jgi:uncharacterized membrane protein YraQ (UPF0718 family)
MREILAETITILNESSVWLLSGFLLAGVLHVVLSRFPQITALFTGGGQRPVYLSAFLGLPMPLCSCGVLPAAMTLRRKGASKGATASFLISVPETDIVSILLTFALLGGVMAWYRPAAALLTAIAAGLAINYVDRRLHEEHMAKHHANGEHSCCCHDKPKDESLMATTEGPWWKRVLHYGFVQIFDDIVAQLFLGILVAGVLMAWLPDVELARTVGSSVWSYAIMLVIGVPVYVCAVASTPVAAGLIAGGLSPGAAMVFLLAGPATNIASLFVLKGEFGKRILALYLVAIGAGSVLLGVLFDALLGGTVTAAAVAEKHHQHGSSPLEIGATVLFLLLILASFKRTNIIRRVKTSILKLAPRGSQH